jgi:hypothetical protein
VTASAEENASAAPPAESKAGAAPPAEKAGGKPPAEEAKPSETSSTTEEELPENIARHLPAASVPAKAIGTQAAAAEPAVTKNVTGATAEAGGEMIGLEHRLKTPESLARKIATEMEEDHISAEEAAARISDAVRYTSSFPPNKLVAGTQKILAKMQSEGNVIVKLKNTWLDPKATYKGINAQVRAPDGQMFEMQFHTPESFWAKDAGTHKIFEAMRKLPKDSPEWKALDDQQKEIFAKLEVPKDIDQIKPIKKAK